MRGENRGTITRSRRNSSVSSRPLLNQKLLLGYGAISVGGLQYAFTQLQQVTVTGQLMGHEARTTVPTGDPNSRDAPTGLVKVGGPTRNISEPYADYYKLQLVKGNTYLKDPGSYARENVSPTGNTKASDIRTSNGLMINMTRGVLLDRVGSLRAPAPGVTETFTAHQVYDAVIYKGFQYPIHVEFDQITNINHGVVTTQLIPVGSGF